MKITQKYNKDFGCGSFSVNLVENNKNKDINFLDLVSAVENYDGNLSDNYVNYIAITHGLKKYIETP